MSDMQQPPAFTPEQAEWLRDALRVIGERFMIPVDAEGAIADAVYDERVMVSRLLRAVVEVIESATPSAYR